MRSISLIELLKKRVRLIKYAIVGGLSAAIKFSIYSVLFYYGTSYTVAATFAYFISAAFHFTANRAFTFKNHTGSVHQQIIKYLVLTAINYTITIQVISYSIGYLHLNPYFSMILAIAANTLSNYLVAKLWVFKIGHVLSANS